MALLGTPYQAGLASTAAVTSTVSVSVSTAVPAGTAVTVFAGASGATTATAVTDSQGNTYTLAASSTTNQYLQAFTATVTTGLSPLAADTWTVTYSASNSQQKTVIAVALAGASGTDVTTPANGSSASASVAGTTANGNETAIACWQAASGTPSPSSFTSLGGSGSTLAGYSPVTSTGSVTASATVTSGTWAALLITWKAAAPVALGAGTAPSGGPQLPPYPVLPFPRTWSIEDKVLTPYLRNDPGNAIALLTSPPIYVGGQTTTGQSITTATVTPVQLDTDNLDAWASHQQPATTVSPPLAGWYLAEGWHTLPTVASTTTACAGIQAVQAGVTTNADGCKASTNVSNSVTTDVADLVQVNPQTSDTISLYALQDTGASRAISTAWLKTEWVSLIAGTTVSSPVPAAGWTSGATVLSLSCAAGATSVLVADPTGIVTGGTISLDYGNAAAEAVSVTSVSGQVIGITACTYPHTANAPVSSPVSAAWMNQQVRDKIRFLAFRPIARLTAQSSAQASLATQTWPAGTAVQWTDPTTSGHRCVDNFAGWASGNPTRYTFPVSGTWYLYGQAYITDSSAVTYLSAGLAISGGTIQWGNRTRSAGSTSEGICATVTRVLRVTAGQYAEVYASQNSAGSLTWKTTAQSCSRFVAVFRGF